MFTKALVVDESGYKQMLDGTFNWEAWVQAHGEVPVLGQYAEGTKKFYHLYFPSMLVGVDN